jgi:hypothetical protein
VKLPYKNSGTNSLTFSSSYFQNDMAIECRLCSPSSPPLGAADGGYTFLRHLSGVHGVPQPGRLVTRLLEPDSGAFTYRRLRAEHEDLHHDPLVNLNPVAISGYGPDSGVSETAAPRSQERRQSGGEGKTAVALNTVSHLCIVCGRSFSSSEEVQCHLIVEHVAAAAAASAAAAGGGETMPPPPVKVEEPKIFEEEEILSVASSGPSDASSNRKA